MVPSSVITVFKCSCESFVLSEQGLETHLHTCARLQNEVATTRNVNLDSCSSTNSEGLTMINFHCPQVRLKRLSSTEIKVIQCELQEEKTRVESHRKRRKLDPTIIPESDCKPNGGVESKMSAVVKAPPPRRSSLLAAQKLRRIHKIEPASCTEKDDFKVELYGGESDQEDYYEKLEEEKVCARVKRRFGSKKVSQDEKKVTALKKQNCGSKKVSQLKTKDKVEGRVSDELYVFKCDKCPTKFTSKKPYEWHMLNVHGNINDGKNHEVLTCPLCGRMVNKRLVFQKHMKYHEDAEALEDAFDLWNKWPDKPPIRRNNKKKSAVMHLSFQCKFCLIPHTSHYSFITHMKQQHPETGRFSKYQCPYCDTSEFDSMKHFMLHMKTSHPIEYYGKTITGTFSELQHVQTGNPKGRCDICNKFFGVFYLRAHKEKKHSTNEKKVQDSLQNDDIYSCVMRGCQANFKNHQQLKRHFMLHLQNNPYACKFPGCEVKCDAQCHLDRHMKLHTAKLLTCDKCGVSYSRIDKLREHTCIFDPSKLKYDKDGYLRPINAFSRLTRIHGDTNEKQTNVIESDVQNESEPILITNDACNAQEAIHGITNPKKNINIDAVFMSDPIFLQVCEKNPGFKELILGRASGAQSKLTPRKYKCATCSTGFYERKALQIHSLHCEKYVEKVENISGSENNVAVGIVNDGVKPEEGNSMIEKVGCPICGLSFKNSKLLESHVEAKHDPNEVFQCTECGIILSNMRRLKSHIHRYHSDHHFPCSVSNCTRTFTSTKGLRFHLKNHPEETTQCSKCGKVLVNLMSLKRHWRSIHGVQMKSLLTLKPKKPLKRTRRKPKNKKKAKKSNHNQNTSADHKSKYNTRNRKKINVEQNCASSNLDYSIVKIETEPETIIDCSYDVEIETSYDYNHTVKQEPDDPTTV